MSWCGCSPSLVCRVERVSPPHKPPLNSTFTRKSNNRKRAGTAQTKRHVERVGNKLPVAAWHSSTLMETADLVEKTFSTQFRLATKIEARKQSSRTSRFHLQRNCSGRQSLPQKAGASRNQPRRNAWQVRIQKTRRCTSTTSYLPICSSERYVGTKGEQVPNARKYKPHRSLTLVPS